MIWDESWVCRGLGFIEEDGVDGARLDFVGPSPRMGESYVISETNNPQSVSELGQSVVGCVHVLIRTW